MGSVDAHGTADCQPVSRLLLAAIFCLLPAVGFAQTPASPPTPNNPPAVRSRFDIQGKIRHFELSPDSRGLQLQHLGGGGGLSAQVFLRPLRHDDSSPSLQPFLQRASSLYITAEGDGAGSSYRQQGQTVLNRTYAAATAGLGAEIYAGRFLYLGAEVGMAYVYLRDTDRQTPPATLAARTWFVPASVSVGLRFSDLLFSIGYSVTVRLREQERADLPSWGVVHLALRTVLNRYIDLGCAATLINGGAGLAIATGTYITPQTGLLASLSYRRGILFDGDSDARHQLGARLGLVYWFSSRIGTVLEGLVQWTSLIPNREPAFTELAGVATLALRI